MLHCATLLMYYIADTVHCTGKVLAQEFAHLAWGVYDEYPQIRRDPQFYRDGDGRVQPNACSAKINGSFTTGRKECDPTKDDRCFFLPSTEQRTTASLMGYAHLDQVMHAHVIN